MEPAARPHTPQDSDLLIAVHGVATAAAILEKLLAGSLRSGYLEAEEKGQDAMNDYQWSKLSMR
jgi:hypothetical protein